MLNLPQSPKWDIARITASILFNHFKTNYMNQFQTAAKLYECRDAAKRFFREENKAELEPYTHIIQAVMKANNLEEIPALLKISQTETYQENPMGQMLFMAAVVELIVPS